MQAGIKLQEESAIDSEVDSTHPLPIRARGTNMLFRNAEMITKRRNSREQEASGRQGGGGTDGDMFTICLSLAM